MQTTAGFGLLFLFQVIEFQQPRVSRDRWMNILNDDYNRCFLCCCLALILLMGDCQIGFAQEFSRSKNGMVATVHPLATDAGVNVLKAGGNAIDAAIAAGLTLGVVDNFNSGIGGGCFILIRTSEGILYAIDGREKAPKASHRDMYNRNGKPVPELSQIGSLASGVPGALAGYQEALRLAGTKSIGPLILPAADIAESGFVLNRVYANAIRSKQREIARFPATKKILFRPDGSPHREGDILVQKDLAKTYRNIASEGVSWFYKGNFASQTERWMQENGGILTAEDFSNYEAVQRSPIKSSYRGFSIIGFPPPSSGGIHVAQILNILENYEKLSEMTELNRNHIIIEAMKLAFADRAHWLGDADFAKVPRGLIDKGYSRTLASKINLRQATKVDSHGIPPNANDDLFSRKHTTHLCVADAQGNWVAMTQTVNTTFGSKVVIPNTGVIMNNEMDDFSAAPGVANVFGLVGAEANSIAGGKRPLSSMSPTIVLRDGQPVMMVGAAGGPKIITQSLLAIIRTIDLNMPLDQALSQPRFHHQWSPDRVLVEKSMPTEMVKQLQAKGHQIVKSTSVGITQAIAIDKNGIFTGVHDPRVPGKAAGFQRK
jgi:gamma-glutamyltranspeptidase / glutathione hydrolase